MSYYSLPTSRLFQLTALTLSLALAGCGGGGTDTVAPELDTGVQQPSTGGGDNGGTEEPVGALNISSSQLVDVDENPITSIGLEGAYYEVIVTDDNGQPLANTKVTFSIDAPGVDLSQTTSGATLTNSEGEARIFLKPNAPEVSGAYIITANASSNNNTAIDNLTFSVQATNVSLSAITVGSNSLASGGQTPISFKVTDQVGNALSGILVNLNSSCGQIPEQVTSDSEGMIKAVFKAINSDTTLCSGNVRISATTGNSTQSTTVTVASAEASSIIYTSNDVSLGIRGSGSSSTGQAEFTVYSGATTLANEQVRVSLEKSPLGLTFGPNRNQQSYVTTTDANGQIVVPIFPGTTPGPVEIEVSLVDDPLINALSKNITVASSRVTQTGLSLSWEKNVLDWSLDGDSSEISARMVDRNGNAVPDGTVINFTAEGGKITSSCATVNGDCAVTFTTQNPRPGDGRVSILAVAEGEKDYIDLNQNNAFDQCEVIREESGMKIYETPSTTTCDVLVHNIGDTFRDDNENGDYEIGEFTYPLTTSANGLCENNLDRYINLKFPSLSDLKRLQYKANYIDEFVSPNKNDTCNNGLDAVVRYQGTTLLADKDAKFTIIAPQVNAQEQEVYASNSLISIRTNSDGFYDMNPMPSGTTIAAIVVDKTGNNDKSCKVEQVDGSKVPALVSTGSPGDNLGTISKYKLEDCSAGDEFTIIATTPNGNVTRLTYPIR